MLYKQALVGLLLQSLLKCETRVADALPDLISVCQQSPRTSMIVSLMTYSHCKQAAGCSRNSNFITPAFPQTALATIA